MIKVKALEKATKFLKSKRIAEFTFSLEDSIGTLQAYQRGVKYQLNVRHDSVSVKMIATKTEWL